MTSISNSLENSESYDSSKPITFKARGLTVDTRLKTFSTVFHVHSVILKLNSHYFYTFLDSVDKVDTPASGSTQFRYDWVTKVDDDGKGWQLVAHGPNAGNINIETSTQDVGRETLLFEGLLRAFYKLPFQLVRDETGYYDWLDLKKITHMAKFYACLPALSSAVKDFVPRAIGRSDLDLVEGIVFDCTLLETMCDLRWADMFRDAFIWALAPWSEPHFHTLADSPLKDPCQMKYHELSTMICKIQQVILAQIASDRANKKDEGMSDGKWTFEERNGGYAAAAFQNTGMRQDKKALCLPMYFRQHYEANEGDQVGYQEGLMDILCNDLTFQYAGMEVGTPGDRDSRFIDHFLCFVVRDDELPWDITQTDW